MAGIVRTAISSILCILTILYNILIVYSVHVVIVVYPRGSYVITYKVITISQQLIVF